MVGKETIMKIGKYTLVGRALNEPSEEAILKCRKIVNEVMKNYLRKRSREKKAENLEC
ncbi:hypothetical protein [Lysinibacillus sphaericus]|uniref:hypothetical protein n=1 Tax=Lysinibacillus sphaericus TaxID=1421 RepID=UPI0003A7076F|nr:hypothetical protein [Lysinibacillus sphaericus]